MVKKLAAQSAEQPAPGRLTVRRGRQVIRDVAASLPGTPGVYRMLDEKDNVLYVGKAKNLRKRVASYATGRAQPIRTRRMVAATASMEIVRTHTEVEALLLESNLIKKLKPRYNVLLRDDKSFPYIIIRSDHPWAQIGKYRGKADEAGGVLRTLRDRRRRQSHDRGVATCVSPAFLLRFHL